MNSDVNGPIPNQRGWFSRNALWFIPLLLVLVAAPFVCCGGLAMFGWGMMKAPKEAAVVALNADPRVVEKLGAPITADSSVSVSNYQNNNNNGSASLTFNASGPKGSANVAGEMTLTAGTWRPKQLIVKCDDGTELTVPDGADSAGE